MKIFSTFTGIGGFEIGIHNAWLRAQGKGKPSEAPTGNTQRQPEQLPQLCIQGLDVVGYSEINKYASSVYERHFKGAKNYGDITKINAKELPDFDCLVGGFPCQAFSIAGKRRGFDDTRGTLFFDLARILREKQPRYFVFENVKGLLSHDQGNTFRTIIATIDELGYDCQWSVLNSKNFGVPQNRERVYIVGHLRGTPRPEVFPIVGTDGEDTRIVGQDVAYTIDANYAKGTNTLSKGRRSVVAEIKQLNQPTHSNDRVYASDGISPTLNTMQGGNRQPFIAAQRGRYNADGKTEQKFEPRYDGISSTLTAVQKDNMVVDLPRIRRLTPIECERLQGFPDNWTAVGTVPCDKKDCDRCQLLPAHEMHMVDMPISDTQRYKMCGNAVTVNVVQAVFERIL